MDIEKYIAGKAKGLSSIELQGDSTLLVSYPDGFDPTTGAAKPNVDRGYQPADLAAMKVSAVTAVQTAQDALTAAQARVAMHDTLLADAAAFQTQIDANLQAAAVAQPVGAATLDTVKP